MQSFALWRESGHGGFALRAAEKADSFQGFVNLFQGLFAEIRNAQQVIARAMEQVVDGENASLLKAIRRADRKADLGRAHVQAGAEILGLAVERTQRNARHWVPSRNRN